MQPRVLVLHTRLLVWASGMTLAPWLVLIHPRHRGDVGLLAHEKVHARQMRRDGLLRFWWRYATSRAHRLAYEVEAYRVSVRHGMQVASAAATLAEGYWLGITAEQARAELLGLPAHDRAGAVA